MRARIYPLLSECIHNGIETGWRRAHKHDDTPDPEFIREQIYTSILFEVHEWFEFDMDAATEIHNFTTAKR